MRQSSSASSSCRYFEYSCISPCFMYSSITYSQKMHKLYDIYTPPCCRFERETERESLFHTHTLSDSLFWRHRRSREKTGKPSWSSARRCVCNYLCPCELEFAMKVTHTLSLSLSLSLSVCVCVGGWVGVRREEKGLACRNSYKNHIFYGENHTKIKFSMEKINACVCVLCAPQRIRLDLLERPLALQHTFVIHTQTSTHIDIHTHTNTDTRTHTLTHTHSLTHTCMHHI